MSASFKKYLPVFILIVVVAGGYLLSNVTGDLFSAKPPTSGIAERANKFTTRLVLLQGAKGIDDLKKDPRYDKLIDTSTPLPEYEHGRSSPFISQ